MMELLIKGLYFLLGGMGGFFVARQLPSRLEYRLIDSIMAGKRVVIAIGDTVVSYYLDENGKVQTQSGTLEIGGE